MDYFEEAKSIWQQFVPKSGQSDTVQGELLRAVEKLRNEAIRNGNGNWDEGFEILLAYLEGHLLDPNVYLSDVIHRSHAILSRLKLQEQPVLEDEPYDYLADRVVDYFRYHGSKPHTHNPALWR